MAEAGASRAAERQLADDQQMEVKDQVIRQGDRIHAVVGKGFIPRFSELLVEGAVVEIKRFTLSENKLGKYMPTTHRCKIKFLERTDVRPAPEYAGLIPLNVYELIWLNDIKKIRADITYVIDIIGVVVGKGDLLANGEDGLIQPRISLDIKDESDQLRITVWGQQALEVEYIFKHGKSGCPVVVGQFMRCKLTEFGVNVSSAMYYGRIRLNPNIQEVVAFKERLTTCANSNMETEVAQIPLSNSFRTVKDFISNATAYNIGQLKEIKEECHCVFVGA